MKLSDSRLAIIAHRGASHDAPENTLESFELAISQGAEWIEFDVRRSRDGVLFIHHDPNRGTTYLNRLDFVEIKELSGSDDIPTLLDLLRTFKGRVKLDIELKEEGYEAEVVDLVGHYFKPEEVVYTSFLDVALAAVKAADSRLRTGLLVGKRLNDQDPLKQLGDLFPNRRVRKIKADFVASHYLLGDVMMRWLLKRSHIPVVMWTIDNPRLMKRYLRDPNVIAIITNKPALGLEIMAQARLRRRQ